MVNPCCKKAREVMEGLVAPAARSRDGSSGFYSTLIRQGWYEQCSFTASRAPGFVRNHSHWLMQRWENVTPPLPSYAPVFILCKRRTVL